MAKSKNSQEVSKLPKSKAELEADRMLQEEKAKEQRAKFELKVEDMAYRAAEYYEKYGEEDYRTTMLMTFLDVALQMKECITNMNDIKDAMKCITDAMLCIDNVYAEMETAFSSTLDQDYSLKNRLKQKRHLNKVMRNNAGRMAQMTDMMLGAHETAMRMVASMQKVGIKLRVRMDKMNRQKAKSNKKSIKKGQPVVTQSAGQAMVMDILKKKNGGDAPSGTPAPSPAPSPVDDKKGGTDNIDDIL